MPYIQLISNLWDKLSTSILLYSFSSFLFSRSFFFFMSFNLCFLTSIQFSLSFFPSLYNLSLTAPNFCFLARTPCCFLSKVPFALIPSTSLWPESTLSVVVLWFDICVYLATACTVGSQTDRAGLNKERKLGKGNTHALRHIHKSWNAG